MRWATRRHCHVDRTACAWLIGRFIDPAAEFVFVDDPDEVPDDATGFDMRDVELTHHDGKCSFEAFLDRYDLGEDDALVAIGRLVHEADVGDDRYHEPQAAGFDLVIRGLGLAYADDALLIGATTAVYDGLYGHFRRAALARVIDELEGLGD